MREAWPNAPKAPSNVHNGLLKPEIGRPGVAKIGRARSVAFPTRCFSFLVRNSANFRFVLARGCASAARALPFSLFAGRWWLRPCLSLPAYARRTRSGVAARGGGQAQKTKRSRPDASPAW